MTEQPTPADLTSRDPRAPLWSATWALGALLLAALVGYLVVSNPELSLLDPSFSAASAALLLVGMAALAIVWIRPDLGVILLTLFVYLNLSQVLVRHHHLPSLLRLLVLILVVAAWRRFGAGRLLDLAARPLSLLMVAYALLLLASSTFASDPALADEQAWEILKATLLFLLFGVLAHDLGAIRRSAWAMVGAGAIVGAMGIVQTVTGELWGEFGGFARIKHAHIYGDVFEPRIAGPLGDPNFFAQILLMVLPLALFLAWNERSPRMKALALAASASLGAAVVLTYSRGAWLAMAFQLLLLLALARRRLRFAGIGLAVLLLVAVFGRGELSGRLTTVQELLPGGAETLEPDSSFEERRLFTLSAWAMFLDHLWLGVGAGNYTERFEEYSTRVGSPARSYDAPGAPHYPHNLYLGIAAESGAVGLAVFLAIVATAFGYLARARSAFLNGADDYMAGMTRAVQISLAGYLASSFFLHGHYLRYLWLVFAFATALYLGSRAVGAPAAPAPAASPGEEP